MDVRDVVKAGLRVIGSPLGTRGKGERGTQDNLEVCFLLEA